jgi:hypothetical protein
MVHHIPAGGMLSHGFVSYTPKFFFALSRSNGYEVVFMSLFLGETMLPVPSDILHYIAGFEPAAPARLRNYRTPECSLVVVFRKIYDLPFVAPLDVGDDARTDDARTDDEKLRGRYPTMFDHNIFSQAHARKLAEGSRLRRHFRILRSNIKRLLQKNAS